MFAAIKSAIVAFFFVLEKFAEGFVNLASAFERSTKAVEVYSASLIPTEEQTTESLRLANESRDINQAVQAAKIQEAKDKLAKARNDKDSK